ncbi:MAG: ATPase [Rhodospirillaceae bacterium]|jgi:chaperone required for assembly of F1-ATPase|nr:ATPase [Rhodospirillaceae bacterium]MBT4587659.1 ATPase [Rhodospirillaceae bacterium]MBT7265464.1 ATPase [Rhodospirillaceae bacterium]
MAEWSGAKRFYKAATVIEGTAGLHVVALDGRSVKTPAGAELGVESQALAVAMAAEWEAQEETIDPHSMPLCKLSATTLDRLKVRRDEVIGITLKIAETDLLCYRAEEPEDLVARQQDSWQPELDWAKQELNAELAVTTGVLPINQPESALIALQTALAELDDYHLMGVTNAAAAAGSLILAFSMFRGRIDADAMFEKSVLEEKHQMELWGEDYEALERHDRIRADIQDSARFLKLLET